MVYNSVALLRALTFPPVAKLDIAVDSDSKGRGFESLRAGQKENPVDFVGRIFFLYYLFFIIQHSLFIRQDFQ